MKVSYFFSNGRDKDINDDDRRSIDSIVDKCIIDHKNGDIDFINECLCKCSSLIYEAGFNLNILHCNVNDVNGVYRYVDKMMHDLESDAYFGQKYSKDPLILGSFNYGKFAKEKWYESVCDTWKPSSISSTTICKVSDI